MNNRISKLRQNLFDIEPRVCSQRCKIFTESMKKSEGLFNSERRAKAFYEVLDKMSLYINEGELIIGNMAKWPKASPIYPEYSVDWLKNELAGNPYYLDQRPGDTFICGEKEKQEILECINYWEGKSFYEKFRKELPKEINEAWDANVIDDTWVSSAGLGNVVVDYQLVVEKGLKDVLSRTELAIKKLDTTKDDYKKKLAFLNSILISNKAVVNFSNRLSNECIKLAENCSDTKRIEELLELSQICKNVPLNPARTFHEAVQAIFIILLSIHLESNGHAYSLGRFDQYVYPLYKNDVEKGILSREEALEIVECFFIKCNELNKLRSWPDSEFFLGYQMFINIAVAGQDDNGNDATNEVSNLCVEACENLKLFTPSVSVKWCEKTSDDFMLKALDAMVKHQGGQPAFYNDLAFMRTLDNMGIKKEDQHNWVPTGCIEASIPGKWDFAAKGPWLNVEKILDILLNNGNDPKTGYHFYDMKKDIKDFANTEEILEEYKKLIKYFIDLQVKTEYINDELHTQLDINAFRSSLMEDCINRGLDLVEGGAIYSADGGPTAGTISSGDSLAAIDYLVFEKRLITMDQLLHALKTNFSDSSTVPTGAEIQLFLKNKAPKFGNDDNKADKWIVALEDFIGSTYRYDCKSFKYGKGPIPSCFSYSQSPVSGNIAFGKSVGATPDGRNDGDPVNNGISPANGSEREGITAACNSIIKLPSIWFQKGAIFNMRLAKSIVSTKENKEKLISVIKVLFKNYGQQIQFNIVDNDVFKKAMENPNDYRDLMVRVSGYSALFTSLSKDCQMDIINRTELSWKN